MNHRRSAKRWIAAIALSGLVAVGCSPTNTEPAESDNGDAGAEVDASGDSDQVLRAAYQYGTSSLDPHTNTGAYSPVTLGLIFDTLIQVTSDGNLVPGLAEDWNFSEDKTELILDIREGVTFHDGTSLDAETVKLNLDRARGVDFDNSAVSGDLSMISDVAVDGNQVIISLEDGEGGTLPAILSDRAGMIASASALEDPAFDMNPVGAGPYKLSSYDPDAYLEVERWEEYWDDSVSLNAGIQLHYVSDSSARLRGIQSGQYDWATVDAIQVLEAEQADLEVLSNATFSYNRIALNRSREWFQDPLVREAMSYAVDRDALVQSLEFGKGQPSYQPFPEDYWGAAPDAVKPEYDPEKAKSLLAEAGYPDGFTFEAIARNSADATQLAEVVAAQLAEVGLNANIRLVDNSTVTFYSNQEGDVWIGPWSGRPDPALTLSLQYTAGKLQNPGGDESEAIAERAAEALRPGTPEEREEAVQNFTQQVLDEHLEVFLYSPELNQVYTSDVEGVEPWVTAKPSLRSVVKP